MKLLDYLNEKYGMTKAVFFSKPEWAKEELRREHQEYCRKIQLEEAEQRRWNSLSAIEKENEETYNNLLGCGVPASIVETLMG